MKRALGCEIWIVHGGASVPERTDNESFERVESRAEGIGIALTATLVLSFCAVPVGRGFGLHRVHPRDLQRLGWCVPRSDVFVYHSVCESRSASDSARRAGGVDT